MIAYQRSRAIIENLKAVAAQRLDAPATNGKISQLNVASLVSKGSNTNTPHAPSLTPTNTPHAPRKRKRRSRAKPSTHTPGDYVHAAKLIEDEHGFIQYREHRTDPRWRDLDEEGVMLAHYNHMSTQGPLAAMTLNLSPEVEAQALAQPNTASWLREKLTRALKQHLGHVPDFVFALDVTDKKSGERLHLHGLINVPVEFHKQVVAALKATGGSWDAKGRRDKQTHVEAAYATPWASYAARNRKRVGKIVRGRTIAGTASARAGAEKAFEHWREQRKKLISQR